MSFAKKDFAKRYLKIHRELLTNIHLKYELISINSTAAHIDIISLFVLY